MQHTSPGGFQVRKLYAVQTPLCSFNKKKYHISRQCLFQIFDSGLILINDNHTLAPVKNPLITPSTDYIDDFVDDISGMFNIYEIIISIHALQFTQLRPILMMTVY